LRKTFTFLRPFSLPYTHYSLLARCQALRRRFEEHCSWEKATPSLKDPNRVPDPSILCRWGPRPGPCTTGPFLRPRRSLADASRSGESRSSVLADSCSARPPAPPSLKILLYFAKSISEWPFANDSRYCSDTASDPDCENADRLFRTCRQKAWRDAFACDTARESKARLAGETAPAPVFEELMLEVGEPVERRESVRAQAREHRDVMGADEQGLG
jgi:hypothetical protein